MEDQYSNGYRKETHAVHILRSRNHNSKNTSVAVGVMYALGHFTAAANFTHDVDAVKDAESRELEIAGHARETSGLGADNGMSADWHFSDLADLPTISTGESEQACHSG